MTAFAEVDGLARRRVRTRASGKVNLQLSVGPRREDGYHPLATVFQAFDLYETLSASVRDVGLISVAVVAARGRVAALRAAGAGAGLALPAAGTGLDLDAPVVVLDPREAKGLEFDVVVLVEPAEVLEQSAGDLYVAMTRPTRALHVVHSRDLPAGF